MDRQKTCEELIAQQLKSRDDDLAGLYAVANGEAATFEGEVMDEEEAHERLDTFALGISTYTVLRIDLSTGGPADWLEVKLDEGQVQNVTYHYADWFDHAEREVGDDEALWQYAESCAECVVGS